MVRLFSQYSTSQIFATNNIELVYKHAQEVWDNFEQTVNYFEHKKFELVITVYEKILTG